MWVLFVVVQSLSHLLFCGPMECSTPDSPELHYLLEFVQIHIHWVGDTIQHLILCFHLLLLPSIFLSIRIFSNESALCIRWPKYWSFNFSISPSKEYSGLISFRIDWFDCLAVQGTVTWGLLIPIKSRTESVLLTFAFPLSIHLLCQSLSHVWLFATPRTVAPPAPLSRKFSGHEYWSRLLFRSQGDLPRPGTESRPPAF